MVESTPRRRRRRLPVVQCLGKQETEVCRNHYDQQPNSQSTHNKQTTGCTSL